MAQEAATSERVHGTTVSLNGSGVLIRGKPGSGKSDLALQLIEACGTGLTDVPVRGALVSDDQTELHLNGTELRATAPLAIAGQMEVRGFAIIDLPHEADVPLLLVVDLAPVSAIARLPSPDMLQTTLLGQRLARIDIDPSSASAAARVRLALMRVRQGGAPFW